MDISGEPHRGVLAADDMARWQATVEAPIAYDYGRYTVLQCGAWKQGLITLQQLALLKGFDLDGLDPAGPDFIHLQVEGAKLAFADRDTFYGDPKFVDVPVETLLSDAYNAERRKLVGDRASLEFRPGAIAGYGKAIDARAAEGERRGRPDRSRRADRRARLDPTTRTIRGGAVPSRGRCPRRVARRHRAFRHHRSRRQHDLGHAVGRLAAILAGDPGARLLPRHAGAAVLARRGPSGGASPGKRPRTTLSPTMALRDGEPYLAWGSPGGDQQDQWIPQFFLRHVHAGHNLQEAIDAPAWHSEHFLSSFWPRKARPGVVVVEGRVPKATVDELRRRGHIVEVGEDWSEGRLTAASRDGIRRKAAANPRGMQGYAAGR